MVVTGTADALTAVTSALARDGIVAQRLRVEQPSLEDAFVAMTGGTPTPAQNASTSAQN